LFSFPEEDERDSACAESVTGLDTIEARRCRRARRHLAGDRRQRAIACQVGNDHQECTGRNDQMMTTDHTWRKSSFSNAAESACVELALGEAGGAVRDTTWQLAA
jgi:hypothetical protein